MGKIVLEFEQKDMLVREVALVNVAVLNGAMGEVFEKEPSVKGDPLGKLYVNIGNVSVYVNGLHKGFSLPGSRSFLKKNGGFGMNELLGIAAALILAAFIIIPGLRNFSQSVITRLTTWWTGTVVSGIFPTS